MFFVMLTSELKRYQFFTYKPACQYFAKLWDISVSRIYKLSVFENVCKDILSGTFEQVILFQKIELQTK